MGQQIQTRIQEMAQSGPRAGGGLVRAAAEYAAGRWKEALQALAGFSTPAALAARGHMQFQLGWSSAAASTFAALAASRPELRHAHFGLGVSLLRTGDYTGAAAAFERAIELDRNDSGGYLGLGYCLLHLKRQKESLAAFQKAVLLALDSPGACMGEAVALQMLGRNAEAEKAYLRILDLQPRSEEAFNNLIALSFAQEDSVAARHYAERLIEINPQSRQALAALSTAALRAGNYRAAAIWCGKLVKVDPGSAAGWANLRLALENLAKPGTGDELDEVFEVTRLLA